MKNLKDAIRQIIQTTLGREDLPTKQLVEVLTSLIEQEKERAVEEFHNFVRSNTLGGRFMDDSGGYFNADAVLREDVEQYLAERKGE